MQSILILLLPLLVHTLPSTSHALLTPAQKLANLINSNTPLKVTDHLSFTELQEALGTFEDLQTPFGWRKRKNTFLALLEPNLPEHYDELELAQHKNEPFTTPLLITRVDGGVSKYLAPRLKAKKMRIKNPTVRPSRCSSLAVNFNDGWPAKNPLTKTWDIRLQPFQKCKECVISFKRFHNLTRRPFDLTTKASDIGNIQLQTHGIQGKQIKPLQILFKRKHNRPNAMYSHSSLRKTFLHPNCRNSPAMGYAGSLRGLAFHKHQANMNEVVIGRKLWIIFPPRSLLSEPHAPCPWPPWKPNGLELPNDGQHIEKILHSFFESKSYNATGSKETLRNSQNALKDRRSCYAQDMTPLQWLVYEYPQMKAKHRPFLFMVQPGQVVWIPDDWPHATINIDDVVYVHKGSCNDQRSERSDRKDVYRKSIERTCRKTGRFCTEYCHAGVLCSKCNGYDDVVCDIGREEL